MTSLRPEGVNDDDSTPGGRTILAKDFSPWKKRSPPCSVRRTDEICMLCLNPIRVCVSKRINDD